MASFQTTICSSVSSWASCISARAYGSIETHDCIWGSNTSFEKWKSNPTIILRSSIKMPTTYSLGNGVTYAGTIAVDQGTLMVRREMEWLLRTRQQLSQREVIGVNLFPAKGVEKEYASAWGPYLRWRRNSLKWGYWWLSETEEQVLVRESKAFANMMATPNEHIYHSPRTDLLPVRLFYFGIKMS